MTKLKGLLKDASELYLATDEDREGEAIAWHLQEELKPKVPVHRMVFHEITQQAIQAAVENPRDLDLDLVEAQEARRILDRLYGYEVSPVLWKKVMSGLSAGPGPVRRDPAGGRPGARADGVPHRVVLGPRGHLRRRRRARRADVPGQAALGRRRPGRPRLRLHLARRGSRTAAPSCTSTAPAPRRCRRRCTTRRSRSARSSPSPTRRKPYAPFRTTTLQQEASRKLGFGASRTMSVAQRLYENGFITYMRTDSMTLSESAVAAARAQVRELYGAEYLPDEPRTYASKVKNAQEAHEAIRPAGDELPDAGADRPDRRRVPALRADLDAHRRLADEGRRRAVGDHPARRRRRHRRGRRLLRHRAGDHLPRLPQGVRRGVATTRTPSPTTARPGCPTCARATPCPRPRSGRPATRPSRRRATPRPRCP